MSNVILETHKPMNVEDVRRKLEPYIGKFVCVEINYGQGARSIAMGYLERFGEHGEHIGLGGYIPGPDGRRHGTCGVRPEEMDEHVAGLFKLTEDPFSGVIGQENVPKYRITLDNDGGALFESLIKGGVLGKI